MELHNLANPANVAYYNPALVAQMQAKLESKMAETGVNFTPSTPYCHLPIAVLTVPMRGVCRLPARARKARC